MSKYDYIYRCFKRKLVDSKDTDTVNTKGYKEKKDIKSNKKALKDIFLGTASGLIIVGIIRLSGISKFNSNDIRISSIFNSSLLNNRCKKICEVQEFLRISQNVPKEADAIINNIAEMYSNNNFSPESKSKLNNDLSNLYEHDLSTFNSEEYSIVKTELNEHIDITKDIVEYYLELQEQSNEASDYLNDLINKSRTVDSSYDDDIKDTITNAGLKYEMLSDGGIKIH